MSRLLHALTKEQLRTILSEVKRYDYNLLYPIIRTLYETGARVVEVLRLEKKNVDLEGLKLHLPDQYAPTFVRSISISKELAKVLASRMKVNKKSLLFTKEAGHPIDTGSLFYLIRNFKVNSSVRVKWNASSFRESYAYHFIHDGKDERLLFSLLGFNNLDSIKKLKLAKENA